jgi:hypothetical protein
MRGLFHHGIVDGDLGQLGKLVGQQRIEVAGGAHARDESGQLRRVLGQLAHDGRDGPDEHAGVPPEVALTEERVGHLRVRFLPETTHLEDVGVAPQLPPLLDVAEPGAGPRRLDSDGDERSGGCRLPRAGPQVAAEGRGVADEVVGGQDGHDGLRVAAQDEAHAKGHGRGGVSLGRLGHDVLRRQLPAGLAHGGLLLAVGQHEDMRGRHRVAEPLDRLLQHRAPGEQFQELLGPGLPAVGPEAFPAAAGQDEDVKRGIHFG